MEKLNPNTIEWMKFQNKLKHVPRTGWQELGIPDEEVESVSSHISSTIQLMKSFNDLYDLNLDINKITDLINIKELHKGYEDEGEESEKAKNESSAEKARRKTMALIEKYNLGDKAIALYDEAIACETEEAKYALMFTKFESDLQAVDYYEKGLLTMGPVLEDIKWFDETTRNQILSVFEKYPIPCLSWLIFDSRYYVGNELFSTLSDDLIEYCIKKYTLTETEKIL